MSYQDARKHGNISVCDMQIHVYIFVTYLVFPADKINGAAVTKNSTNNNSNQQASESNYIR